LTVSGRDYVDRRTHEFAAKVDCRGFPWACLDGPVARTNGRISLRLIRISDADETASCNTGPWRLKGIISHVDVRLSAPMSSSALGPLTAHSAPKGRAAGGSSKAGVGPYYPVAPAARSRTVDPVGSGGRRCVAGHVARSRPCVVADGVVVQSGHPIRAVDVPN
jgi:hypothetical protein